MKKKTPESAVAEGVQEPDELRPDYDPELLRQGIRGKYAQRFREGTNIVVLDPDIAMAFPDSASVNAALRALLEVRAVR